MKSRTVGVENASNANINAVLPVETVGQCLRNAFPLIVAGAGADRINVAPTKTNDQYRDRYFEEKNSLILWLRMNLGITINLLNFVLESDMWEVNRAHPPVTRTRCARDKETSLCALCKTKHVQRAHERRLDCLYSVELIMGGRCRARQVIDL